MTDYIADGRRAEQELRLTEAAFTAIRSGALESIAQSMSGERDKREELYRTVAVIDAVRQQLRSIMDTGKMEEDSAARRAKTGA